MGKLLWHSAAILRKRMDWMSSIRCPVECRFWTRLNRGTDMCYCTTLHFSIKCEYCFIISHVPTRNNFILTLQHSCSCSNIRSWCLHWKQTLPNKMHFNCPGWIPALNEAWTFHSFRCFLFIVELISFSYLRRFSFHSFFFSL